MPQPLHVAILPNNIEKHFGENGWYTITDPARGTARRTGTDSRGGPIYETEGNLFDELAKETTEKNVKANQYLDRINIVDRSGNSIAILEKTKGIWQVTRTRRN
jgi:hypothetical protein